MLYKTIVMGLIEEQTNLHRQLKQRRRLLATVETLSQRLKELHEEYMEALATARPESHRHLLGAEALELALAELVLPEESHDSLETDSTPRE